MQTDFGLNKADLAKLTDLQLSSDKRLELLKQHKYTDGICERLKTNSSTGLTTTTADLEARKLEFGCNHVVEQPPRSFLKLLWLALHDNLLVILLVCASISIILSMLFEPDKCVCIRHENLTSDRNISTYMETIQPLDLDWIEGVAILAAVFVVVLVTAFNDWSKEKQFRLLQTKLECEHRVTVLRDSLIQLIPSTELLVGDIAFLNYGNIVPADGLLIEMNNLKIDQAVLTGESELIEKTFKYPIVFNSTLVMEGDGKFLVLAVGASTQTGQIMSMLNDIEQEHTGSLLQLKLQKLAAQIGYMGILVSVATVGISFARFFLSESTLSVHLILQKSFEFIITGITVLVMSIPEGLPLAVTLSLAYAVKKMIQDNNLVRHLYACETMGNVTTICSDKTGTLTTNCMTVVDCYVNDHLFTNLTSCKQHIEISKKLCQILCEAISVNTSYTSNIDASTGFHIGSKTECSLIRFVDTILEGNYANIRSLNPTKNFIHVYTFNSNRKLMATCIAHPSVKGGVRLYCKGAAELIVRRSSYVLLADEVVLEIQEERIMSEVVNPMSSSGLRTIGIAYKDYLPLTNTLKRNEASMPIVLPVFDWTRDEDKICSDLTLISVCGIQDPVRPEVVEAIQKCQKAGIVVRMVTGDNLNTAKTIAVECGIVEVNCGEGCVLEGREFEASVKNDSGQFCQDKFDALLPKLRVLARSTPQNKYDLVNWIISSNLSSKREVVAVTGDGTNDGPALKRADVGFAMGIQGTDIAKEASDIILIDDNFNSIVKAVMWGRNVYDSISKFIQFQLTVNLVAIVCMLVGAIFGIKPLNSVQMLWINLIMDSLASLALATDPPTDELLTRKPYGRTSPLITKIMKKNILSQAFYQISVVITLLFAGPMFIEMDLESSKKYDCPCLWELEPKQHLTLVFNTFVVMTLCNEISSRKIHGEWNIFTGILRNYLFCFIWLTCVLTQVLIVYFGKYGFNCKALNWKQWMWSIGFGLGSLIWSQLVSLVPLESISLERKRLESDFLKLAKLKADVKRLKKIQWLRSYSKIKNELRVIKAFKAPANSDV